MVNIVKFAIICILFAALSHGAIVIDIEPEEMQRIAEILVENYLEHNLTPRAILSRRDQVIIQVKKISLCLTKLMGITMSLVGANLITSMFESNALPPMITNATSENSTAKKPSELCNRDFGCDRNICWRACDVDPINKEFSESWCYTTPKPEMHTYQQCIYSHDCSPCWECLGSCHVKRTWIFNQYYSNALFM